MGLQGCVTGGVGLAEDGLGSSAELSSQLYRHLTLGWVMASASSNENRRHRHPRAKHYKDTVRLRSNEPSCCSFMQLPDDK